MANPSPLCLPALGPSITSGIVTLNNTQLLYTYVGGFVSINAKPMYWIVLDRLSYGSGCITRAEPLPWTFTSTIANPRALATCVAYNQRKREGYT